MFRESFFSLPTLLVLLCIVGVFSFAAPRTADAHHVEVTGATFNFQKKLGEDSYSAVQASTSDTTLEFGDRIIVEVTFSAAVDINDMANPAPSLFLKFNSPSWVLWVPFDSDQLNVTTARATYTVKTTQWQRDDDPDGIELHVPPNTDSHNPNRFLAIQGSWTQIFEAGTTQLIAYSSANQTIATAANMNAPKVVNTRPQIVGYRTDEDSRKFTSLPTKSAPSHTFTVWEHNLHAAHAEGGARREPTAHGGYLANQIVLADSHATLRDAYFYGEGDEITAEITFDEPVKVSTNAVWTIELDGDSRRIFPNVPAGYGNKLIFSYIVGSGASANDLDGDFDLSPGFKGTFPSSTYWTVASESIADIGGNILVDGIRGGSTFTTLTLDPRTSRGGTYDEGTSVRHSSFKAAPYFPRDGDRRHGVDTLRATARLGEIETGVETGFVEKSTLAAPETGALEVTVSFHHHENYGGGWIFAEFHPTTDAFLTDFETALEAGLENGRVTDIVYHGVQMSGDAADTGRYGEVPFYTLYTALITPDLGVDGALTLQVPENAVDDIAGNGNFASNVLTVPIDTRLKLTEAPEIVESAAGAYTVNDKIEVEVTYDRENLRYEGDNPPYLTLYLGEEVAANARHAVWTASEDANSTKVTFTYTVAANDVAASLRVAEEIGLTVPRGTRLVDDAGSQLSGTGELAKGSGEGLEKLPPETQQLPLIDTSRREVSPVVLDTPVVPYTPIIEESDPKAAATDVPRSPVVFNELGNGSGDTNDWLELRNVTGAAVSLNGWELSIVQDGKKEDTSLIVFVEDVSVPANGLLLITNSDPTDDNNPLAGGDDVATSAVETKGSSHLYLVKSGLSLPDDGKFLLILRNAKEKLGLNAAFVDVAGGGGSDTDAFVREQTGDYDTHVWPLQVLQAPGGDTEDALGSGKVWQRAKADIVGYHRDAWAEAAFTGIGYDRQVTQSAATSGTPGYPNVAAKETATKGSVTLSEIMLDSAGGTLPQWIELYNNSKTDAINLNRWQLELQNVDSEDLVGRPIVTLTLGEKVIQPNQTLLIVAGPARASSGSYLPADRVYDLLALHEKNLRIKSARDTFLSTEGFYLKLTDRNGELVDEVGNTDGDRRSDDAPAWAVPLSGAEGSRSSLIRRYTDGTSAAAPGRKRSSWVLAARVKKIASSSDVLYWGDADDIGTPGHREGGALPVELSSFSMTRHETGAVVLTWTTESEVDNAGFNLRRSEKRASGFTLLNPALIAGAGTTGERQTYTFTDTSAKPGVEYYYQIEEVAFDGKRETLVTRLLPGPVSAANRMLTTFGEVKRQK